MRTHLGFALLALLAAAGTAAAQSYESCSGAVGGSHVGAGPHSFNTAGASVDSSPVSCASVPDASADLWFRYVAGVTGTATLSATDCETILAVQVAVYSACSTEVFCKDDLCSGIMSFAVAKDVSYLIRVGDYSGYDPIYSGLATLNITEVGPPTNDVCGGASTIGAGTTSVNFAGATTDATVIPCADTFGSGINDVWFRYVAAATGTAVVRMPSTQQGEYTLVGYEACGSSAIGCDAVFGLGWMSIPVVNGQDYYVRVAYRPEYTPTGPVNMTVTEYATPASNACAGAIALTDNVATNWNNAGTCDPFGRPPASCSSADQKAGMWFSYTASAPGMVVFNTDGSNQNTLLEGFTSCAGSAVACSDNLGIGSANRESYLAIPVASGQTVYARLSQVAQGNADFYRTGTIKAALVARPVNDDCGGAIAVNAGTTPMDNRNASTGNAGPHVCESTFPSRNDLWFRYTPNQTGSAVFHTCAGASGTMYLYDTIMSLYDGCGGSLLACTNGSDEREDIGCFFRHSYIRHNVVAGKTYYIRVGSEPSESDAVGAGNLTIAFTPVPDAWVESKTFGGDAGELLSSAQATQGSTALSNILGSISTSSDADLYKIEICNFAAFSATTVNPESENINTTLFLFDASGNGVAFNDHTNPTELRATLSNQLVGGNGIYYLAVGSGSGFTGDLENIARLPQSVSGAIWEADPRNVEREPDAFGGALIGWVGQGSAVSASFRSYRVALTGVCFAAAGCAADFNGDNTRDVADLFAYINAWLAKTPNANFNEDGAVDVADLFAYINAWLAGC